MNYDFAFKTMQEQYEKIYEFMQNMDVAVDVLRENNTTNTIKIDKTLKRIARIEDKLKIVNIDEEIKEGE